MTVIILARNINVTGKNGDPWLASKDESHSQGIE